MNRTTTPMVATPSAFAGLRWLFAAWVATALLFAHGCHGPDEDHELSVIVSPKRERRE